jgi:hypothetical protein
MSQKPNAKRTTISEMQDQTILKTLFGEAATVVVTLIKSVELTEVGKKPADSTQESETPRPAPVMDTVLPARGPPNFSGESAA